MITKELLAFLRCPIDGNSLELSVNGRYLLNRSGGRCYPVQDNIIRLLPEDAKPLSECEH